MCGSRLGPRHAKLSDWLVELIFPEAFSHYQQNHWLFVHRHEDSCSFNVFVPAWTWADTSAHSGLTHVMRIPQSRTLTPNRWRATACCSPFASISTMLGGSFVLWLSRRLFRSRYPRVSRVFLFIPASSDLDSTPHRSCNLGDLPSCTFANGCIIGWPGLPLCESACSRAWMGLINSVKVVVTGR